MQHIINIQVLRMPLKKAIQKYYKGQLTMIIFMCLTLPQTLFGS